MRTGKVKLCPQINKDDTYDEMIDDNLIKAKMTGNFTSHSFLINPVIIFIFSRRAGFAIAL